MLGNFTYCNPTKLYFGEDSLSNLKTEIKKYGTNVVLVYGGGSIKKNGIYDQVMAILNEEGKNVAEIAGVMPNPTVEKLYEGVEIARKHNVDILLAVGGGSVCDYAKAVSVSVNCDEDPWEKYYIKFEEPTCETIPVGCVLTMVGTGSEMNAGSVITNHKEKLKVGHVFADEKIMPRFSILNPRYTSRIANKNPQDYEARSNIMWTATWALNTLVAKAKSTDWMVHMLGQSAGACTDATHGMTLAAVSLPYYKHIMPYGLPKFVRFAENVWNVNPDGKTDEQIALEGLSLMEDWMKELGLVMNLTDLGATEEMIPDLVKGTFIMTGGYKKLDKEEIEQIFRESLKK